MRICDMVGCERTVGIEEYTVFGQLVDLCPHCVRVFSEYERQLEEDMRRERDLRAVTWFAGNIKEAKE